MNLTVTGWSLTGIAAAILIAAGILLLVVYAFRRGLHHRELDGTDPESQLEAAASGSTGSASIRDASRNMGAAGAVILVLGLALGVIAATGGWGTQQTAGPGTAPQDCAQTWNGCPQATVAP
jgi:predicted permease